MNPLFYQHYPAIEDTGKLPIICLHGWGFHADVWQPLAADLSHSRDVYAVDLPGYGRSQLHDSGRSLRGIAALLQAHFPFPAIYIGWSLGGLCAQTVALDFPAQVSALILISTSPCFVQKPDWQTAMPESVFLGFAEQMTEDLERTLKRFLSLQVLGSADAANLSRQLKHSLSQYHANPEALKIGLGLLQQTDLRQQSAKISCPSLLCLGEKDRIVPVEIAEAWPLLWQAANLEVLQFKQAAHVPFLSHQAAFVQQLQPFLDHVD